MTTGNQQIPVLILAGGLGTRFAEETHLRPKPMIEIGHLPILVHVMRWYYSFGFNDFVICGGYRSWDIKNFFLTYLYQRNHIVIDHRDALAAPPAPIGINEEQERWRVRVLDTGVDCMTGGRVARALDIIKDQDYKDFALTYGDGLSDLNLDAEVKFHRKHGKIGTVAGVAPIARFGELDVGDNNQVLNFLEKPQSRQGLINGGFFLFKREIRDYLCDDPSLILERKPLANLASDKELMLFEHKGFWHPMDSLRDKNHLQAVWDSGDAPWKPRATPNQASR